MQHLAERREILQRLQQQEVILEDLEIVENGHGVDLQTDRNDNLQPEQEDEPVINMAAAARDPKVDIPRFTGSKDTCTIREWCKRVDMVKNACNWTQAKTAEVAKNRLEGSAFSWLDNQMENKTDGLDVWIADPANDADGFPVPHLRNLLIKRFGKTKSEHERVNMRNSLIQQEEEEAADFLDRIHSTVYLIEREEMPQSFINDAATRQAYRTVHDNQCFTYFLNGLRNDIRKIVSTLPLKTLEEALLAAEQAENTLKLEATKITKQKQPPQMDVLAATAMNQQTWPRQGRGRGRNPWRGQMGWRGQRGRGRGPVRNQAQGSICYYCDRPNHFERECYAKQRDIQDRQIGRSAGQNWKQRRQQQRGPMNQAPMTAAMAKEDDLDENNTFFNYLN